MTDGIDHINVYSKGATGLGRELSNFSSHRVNTHHGEFASIEGYWYWLGAAGHSRREELRTKTGWEAKALGRELRAADWGDSHAIFKLAIVYAMVSKLLLHPCVYNDLKASTLPFRHYYVYGDKVIEPANGRWVIETWEHLRRLIQAE